MHKLVGILMFRQHTMFDSFKQSFTMLVSMLMLLFLFHILINYIVDNINCLNCFLGTNLAFWVQTTLIGFSAFFAYLAFRSHEKTSRQRATIDLMLAQNSDSNYQTMRDDFAKLRADKADLTTQLNDNPISRREDNRPIMAVLNQYEFISTGIREKALDEKIYRSVYRGILIRDYEFMTPWLTQLRSLESNPKIGEEFERLALKWKKESVRSKNL